MERATHEDDSNDDGTFLARMTARQEKDEELDLAREDKLGVLIDQEWWPSCEDYFSEFTISTTTAIWCGPIFRPTPT